MAMLMTRINNDNDCDMNGWNYNSNSSWSKMAVDKAMAFYYDNNRIKIDQDNVRDRENVCVRVWIERKIDR